MFVSKHHYAIELAKRGNTVFFLNPPDQVSIVRKDAIEIKRSELTDSLFLIEHQLFFPYALKFHALWLFQWMMQFHIRKLLKLIGRPVDIVWSFDLGNLYPFRIFKIKSINVFHPVDEPMTIPAIQAARGANIIFSVTHEILEKYRDVETPKHFINHGVTVDFFAGTISDTVGVTVRIGFSGNLLRPDIDRETLLQIVNENPDSVFEFWGSYRMKEANIGGNEDPATRTFIDNLKSKRNVILHGAVPAQELAHALQRMDAFLICYDINLDQSKGTNYHKVMEYLAMGKVVISNNITTYRYQKQLVQMTDERDHNKLLPELFRKVISNLSYHNGIDFQNIRRSYALDNTYEKQLNRISKFIYG